MNKNKLNNEIILCRPAVRRARVIVIRKILKKMKILKSCKNEAMKEKKLSKAERLFARVQEMKKLKVDDVTKFALQNENYETFLKESPKNLKNIALATLAKHSCVYSKITEIRNQIPNWKTALPLLLNPIKKDKPMEKVREKVQDKKQKFNKSQGNILRTNNSISKSRKGSKNKETEWLSVLSPNNTKNTEVEVLKSSLEENKCNTYEKKANNFALPAEQEKKIDDPFFIEKKVAVPKLLLYEETENKKTNTVSKFDQQQKSSKTNFNRTSFKPKEDAKHEEKEEVLHPSWAAKKIKFIKPFEGKKIKFSDD